MFCASLSKHEKCINIPHLASNILVNIMLMIEPSPVVAYPGKCDLLILSCPNFIIKTVWCVYWVSVWKPQSWYFDSKRWKKKNHQLWANVGYFLLVWSCLFWIGHCQTFLAFNALLSSWQDDEVVLQCVAIIQKEHRKFCLGAEGLGNRVCYLEPTSEAKVRTHWFV